MSEQININNQSKGWLNSENCPGCYSIIKVPSNAIAKGLYYISDFSSLPSIWAAPSGYGKTIKQEAEEIKSNGGDSVKITDIAIVDKNGRQFGIDPNVVFRFGEPFTVFSVIENQSGKEVNVLLTATIDGAEISGTRKTLRVPAYSKITSVNERNYKPYRIAVQNNGKNSGYYTICIVARPMEPGYSPSRGCATIRVAGPTISQNGLASIEI